MHTTLQDQRTKRQYKPRRIASCPQTLIVRRGLHDHICLFLMVGGLKTPLQAKPASAAWLEVLNEQLAEAKVWREARPIVRP